ncbi:MAG: UDP-N-acetylmuramoyl-L-alanyl-D-glutamate synthetase [Frankiales bacterium]|nr:UDP-N-acetylmuramoyl-L-alanyl-D-glutamate synthetase [Frankiales bacterium]
MELATGDGHGNNVQVLHRDRLQVGGVKALGGREWLALLAGRAAASASRATGRGAGATLPGKVAGRVAPGLLASLGAGRRIAVVSGTNGKTTTTRMLTAALRSTGPVLSNEDGSNLARGVLTALMTDPRRRLATCVFEVDELALDPVAGDIHPDLFVLCNLSRDQLDRMTEVRVLVGVWQQLLGRAAAEAEVSRVPAPVVVANVDDPMVVAAVLPGPGSAPVLPVIWVSAGQPWSADAAACPRCSRPWDLGPRFACRYCDFAQPEPTWHLAGDTLVGPQRIERALELSLPGRANRANAVMAAAAAAQLGIPVDSALPPMRRLDSIGGRYASVDVAGVPVRLLLAKNPAGWQEMLALGVEEAPPGPPGPVVLALNAQGPDGKDTSWIWDVPFEQLADRVVYVSGERAEDLAVRLRYAEVAYTLATDPLDAVSRIDTAALGRRVDLLANYTAFTALCRRLAVP